MSYFNYHATAKKLIRDGKLKAFLFTDRYNNIAPRIGSSF